MGHFGNKKKHYLKLWQGNKGLPGLTAPGKQAGLVTLFSNHLLIMH